MLMDIDCNTPIRVMTVYNSSSNWSTDDDDDGTCYLFVWPTATEEKEEKTWHSVGEVEVTLFKESWRFFNNAFAPPHAPTSLLLWTLDSALYLLLWVDVKSLQQHEQWQWWTHSVRWIRYTTVAFFMNPKWTGGDWTDPQCQLQNSIHNSETLIELVNKRVKNGKLENTFFFTQSLLEL